MSEDLPTLHELRASFLDDLRSEDDQGLWEVVWGLNSECPSVSIESKVTLARTLVFDLLEEGVVRLIKADWPDRGDDGRPLSDAETNRLRMDDRPWVDPNATPDLIVWVSYAGSA